MPIRYLSGLSVDSTVLVVDAVNDRVGIGTASPNRLLQVAGSVYINTNLDVVGTIFGSTNKMLDQSATYTRLYDAAGTLVVSIGSGNVLIGTTTDNGYKLNVNGSIYATGAVFDQSVSTDNSFADANNSRILKPNGGRYYSYEPSQTGAIRITYPVGWTNTMHRVRVNVYDYQTNESFTIYFGGYNYEPGGGSWNNCFAYILNQPSIDRNFNVRFGYTGTYVVVYIGELASSWTYPQVFIEEVECGFGGLSDTWKTGAWSIGFETSAFLNVGVTISNPQSTNLARSGSNAYYNFGNVGIGTTSPAQKLQVVGNAWINRPSNKVDNNGATEFGSRVEFNNSFASNQSGYMVFLYPSYNNFLIGGDHDGNIGGVAPNIQFGRSNGTVYMHIASSNGNVGIGTTSPGTLLHLVQSSGPTIRLVRTSNRFDITADNDFMELNARDASTYMTFRTADTERMRITSAGNVGIGTTAPADTLQVNGGVTFGSDIVANNRSRIYESFGLNLESGAASRPITFRTNLTERMRITDGGNVGIGTTAPATKLRVESSGSSFTSPDNNNVAAVSIYNSNNASTNAHAVISLRTQISGGNPFISFDVENETGYSVGMENTSNQFRIAYGWNSLTTYPAICITPATSPNVLIGTTTDAGYKLQVEGSVRSVGAMEPSNTTWINAAFTTKVGGSAYGGGLALIDGTAGWATYTTGSGQFLNFSSGATSGGVTMRMRLQNNGAVNLSAYGSGSITGTPAYNLGVDASGNVIELPGGVVDGSGTANYVTKWSDANTVTDSQMFDNGTNVGINNATPKTKLDINGTIGFGSKSLNISDTFVTVLTVNMSNHTGCYVKITAFGDWNGHSAVAYLGEFFLQNGASAYNEPGVIIRQVDNTNTDDVVAQIVDPAGTGTRDFEIQLKTTSASGVPFTAAIQYEVRGQYNSVS